MINQKDYEPYIAYDEAYYDDHVEGDALCEMRESGNQRTRGYGAGDQEITEAEDYRNSELEH